MEDTCKLRSSRLQASLVCHCKAYQKSYPQPLIKPCHIRCHKQEAKYTCPRCHIRYCSITCYRCQDHEQCSETFYRECFMDGLHDFHSTEDDKQKVVEMLQRLDSETPDLDSDDDDEPDLEERMAGLDLDEDTDEVWRRLTEREKAEFTKMAEDGRLSAMVHLWEPWWRLKDKKMEEVGATESPPSMNCPKLHHAPELSSIMKGTPSPTIPFSVVNILYGYAYVTRLHNGSHGDTPLQTIKELENISEATGVRTFEDVSTALHGCFHCLQQKAKSSYVSADFQVATLTDVKSLLQGPSERASLQYVMAALSDIHHMARAAGRLTTKDFKKAAPDSTRHGQLEATKKRLFGLRKKMEFLLSWSHRYGLQLADLSPLVDLEFCVQSTEMSRQQDVQQQFEQAWGGKRPPKMHRFIEEIGDR